jgi:DNA invertase Pin-like site-specific DNA recombinase
MSKGKRIGYIRVSSVDQNPERQLEGIDLDKKFTEYASGSTLHRPLLDALREYVRDDDIVFVHSIDRLARNVKNLLELVDEFKEKKVEVHFVKENLIFNQENNASSKAMLGIFGIVAEFERELILERQRYGIAQAKMMGKYKGRNSKFNPQMCDKIKEAMKTREPKSVIAAQLGISRFTLYQYLKKIKNTLN